MSQLIDWLIRLNAKERFFLVGHVLGNEGFDPTPAFRDRIAAALGVAVPQAVFAAMDYHIDWLCASLHVTTSGGRRGPYSREDGCVMGDQEDIDFLIAFDAPEGCHIVLLEAKGVTAWNNKQMDSKAVRFGKIFGADGARWPGVIPHFALVSPRPPQKLGFVAWPTWMAPNGQILWIELPGTTGKFRVYRGDEQCGETQQGQFWCITER